MMMMMKVKKMVVAATGYCSAGCQVPCVCRIYLAI